MDGAHLSLKNMLTRGTMAGKSNEGTGQGTGMLYKYTNEHRRRLAIDVSSDRSTAGGMAMVVAVEEDGVQTAPSLLNPPTTKPYVNPTTGVREIVALVEFSRTGNSLTAEETCGSSRHADPSRSA